MRIFAAAVKYRYIQTLEFVDYMVDDGSTLFFRMDEGQCQMYLTNAYHDYILPKNKLLCKKSKAILIKKVCRFKEYRKEVYLGTW